MKKEDFRCPCCGFPNHLGFECEDDYNALKNITIQLENYIKGDFEYEVLSGENAIIKGQELKKRLAEIQSVSNKFLNQTYLQWFTENVVCFIQRNKRYRWLGRHQSLRNLESRLQCYKWLNSIEEHILIPIELQNIEKHTKLAEELVDNELHIVLNYDIQHDMRLNEIDDMTWEVDYPNIALQEGDN